MSEAIVKDLEGNVVGTRPIEKAPALGLVNALQGQKGSVVIKAHEAGQRVLGEILAAKAAPRDMEEVEREILRQCRDKYFCEEALYLKPTAGIFIEGLGIDFAKALAQIYGNLHYETIQHSKEIATGETQLQCVIWDKERNMTRTETVIVLHKKNAGGNIVDIVDPDAIRLAISRESSYLERNCLFDVFNPSLLRRCFETVLATLDKNASEAMANPTATLKKFASEFGVNEGQIMKFLNITKVDQFKTQHVRRLGMVFRAWKSDPDLVKKLISKNAVVSLEELEGDAPSKEIAPAAEPEKEKKATKKKDKEKTETTPASNVESQSQETTSTDSAPSASTKNTSSTSSEPAANSKPTPDVKNTQRDDQDDEDEEEIPESALQAVNLDDDF